MENVKRKKFYLLNDTFMLHDRVMSCCKSNGFMPNIILESAQWDLLIEAVCTSDGVTFLPKPIVDKFCFNKVHQFSVHKLDLLWIPTVTYHREKFITTPIKLFLEFIKKKSYLEKNREEFLFCV
nr:LysR substrate-binding domain-containing protein [Megasphaera lornae]